MVHLIEIAMPEPVTFFEHQDQAKRRSRWALSGFALTVLGTVGAVTAFLGWVFWQGSTGPDSQVDTESFLSFLIAVAGGTLTIILLSWAFRMLSLSGGPAKVMKSLGGEQILPDTLDPQERQLLNLVEEMSLASGLPVPDLYLLDSPAINACATGLQTDKAAVAVTRGALECFNRDEMQGVIAHEFSHILHGDMAINTQMIAWLGGLFTVSELGRFVMLLSLSSSNHSRSRDKDKGNLALAALGAVIWLLGSIGVFFGKLLQAALSRQREFLADASAVQYTRNPDGIANALRKLGDQGREGRMDKPQSDCAHLMFSSLRSASLTGLLATHPPLPERIRRVQPGWDGSWLERRSVPPPPPPTEAPATDSPAVEQLTRTALLAALLDSPAPPGTEALDAVAAWRESLPAAWLQATHHPTQATALVFRLLVPEGQEPATEFTAEQQETYDLLKQSPAADAQDRLPLVDLALPALRQLIPPERERFLQQVDALCTADGQIDLFEYALRRILHNALQPGAGRSPLRSRLPDRKVLPAVQVMLSVLSRLGARSEEAAGAAFAQACDAQPNLTRSASLTLLPASDCGLQAMDTACDLLSEANPPLQQQALAAGLSAIAADDCIEPAEWEAFRAFAAAMHIPVPSHWGLGRISA